MDNEMDFPMDSEMDNEMDSEMDNEMDYALVYKEVYREMARMVEKNLRNIICTQQKCEEMYIAAAEASDKAKGQKSAAPKGASVPDEK